ncbi:MAG: hypothetical protein JXA10_19835 [Anaerolineae bacterium]|nr:hypothetical protein [Anaerolineae bacterium]
MTLPTNLPGPGEHNTPPTSGEASDRVTPQGDLAAFSAECRDCEHIERHERRALEMPAVSHPDSEANLHRRSVLRRTGTDHDAIHAVRTSDDLPEHRLDQSAHDLQRETRFDPAQDNVGPQSDKS